MDSDAERKGQPSACPSRLLESRPALKHLLPFLSVTLALGLRQLLDPVLGDSFAYLLIYPAVLVAGWFGGIRSALIVLALGLLGGRLFFVQPRSTFVLPNPRTGPGRFLSSPSAS
jgi:K+-sensing histidine kinase KdpD